MFSLGSFRELRNKEEIMRVQIYSGACTWVFELGFGIILLKPTAVSIRKLDI